MAASAPPYRTVLCATDLSPEGDRAAAVAFALAARGGVVHLLHVLEPAAVTSPIDGTYLTPIVPTPEEEAALRREAAAHLAGLVPADAVAQGVRGEPVVLRDASVGGTIVAEAKRRGADAIVLGTRARPAVERIFVGSVATFVARHAPVTVVLVHEPRGERAAERPARE